MEDNIKKLFEVAPKNIPSSIPIFPLDNVLLLPFGKLREKKKNFKRSDYIIITKCDLSLDNKKKKYFSNHLCNKPTYFCQTKYLDLTHIRTK